MNSAEKTTIEVDIFGTTYRLKGNNNAHYLKMIADYVNEQMYKIADGHPKLDRHSIAVLAAVNIADEYFKLKNDISIIKEKEEMFWSRKYEQSQQELEQLKLQMDEEINNLRAKLTAESEQQRDQLMQELEKLRRENSSQDSLKEQLRNLQEEYTKLQNEYNEWIQLAELDIKS